MLEAIVVALISQLAAIFGILVKLNGRMKSNDAVIQMLIQDQKHTRSALTRVENKVEVFLQLLRREYR